MGLYFDERARAPFVVRDFVPACEARTGVCCTPPVSVTSASTIVSGVFLLNRTARPTTRGLRLPQSPRLPSAILSREVLKLAEADFGFTGNRSVRKGDTGSRPATPGSAVSTFTFARLGSVGAGSR